MQTYDNTVLVTGGSSGIGRGLAVAMHRADNRVVIAGRRPAALRAVTDAHPGMRSLRLDVSDTGSLHGFARQIERDFPDLNVVINDAGIMAVEDLSTPDPATVAAVVSTYSATKAGLHSYTESLRFLLRDSRIQVIEIARRESKPT